MRGETPPREELSDALAGLTRRIEELAAHLARLGPAPGGPAPAGAPLDESTRARLQTLRALLAVGPALGRQERLALAVDRAVHLADADCAALFLAGNGGGLQVAARRGFAGPAPLEVGPTGLVTRAYREGEIFRAGPADQAADPLLLGHGILHALALPVQAPDHPPAGVLLVGRRRTVPFDDDALRVLAFLADRVAVLLEREPGMPAELPGFALDLDLERAAAGVAREAARRLGAAAVAVLLPGAPRCPVAGGVGLPPEPPAPEATRGALAVVLRDGRAWVAGPEGGDPELASCLGAPARLVVPLAVEDRVVALLAAAGPGPMAVDALGDLAGVAAGALRNARLYRDLSAALAELRGLAAEVPPPAPPPVRDLGSLLAVVLARVAIARERVSEPSVARELGIAEEAAWRAVESVRAFLGFAPGRREALHAPLDLAAVIRAAAERTRRRWASRRAEPPAIALDLEPLPPVRGSVDDLAEALDHLLENAAEATLRGAGIAVRARWDGGSWVEVTVTDRGAGMPPEIRERALEPFFTTRGPGRLGLGLPVAQAIVLRHRGTLVLESAPGEGTTVRVVLPTAGARPAPPPGNPDPAAVRLDEAGLPRRAPAG